MATRMSSGKTLRPKTLNRGATDDRTRILAYLRRQNEKIFSCAFRYKKDIQDDLTQKFREVEALMLDAVYDSRSADIAWIENLSERAGKRKGGLGRK